MLEHNAALEIMLTDRGFGHGRGGSEGEGDSQLVECHREGPLIARGKGVVKIGVIVAPPAEV